MPQRPEEATSSVPERGEMAGFAQRLKVARQEAGLDSKPPEPPPPFGLAAYALRLATELVAGVLVGGFIGWWIYKQLAPSPAAPLAFIACFALGAAAGAWNIVRAVKRMNAGLKPGSVQPAPEREGEE
jgi:ATP synthase protein I